MWKENWNKFIKDLKALPSKISSNEIAEPVSSQKRSPRHDRDQTYK